MGHPSCPARPARRRESPSAGQEKYCARIKTAFPGFQYFILATDLQVLLLDLLSCDVWQFVYLHVLGFGPVVDAVTRTPARFWG